MARELSGGTKGGQATSRVSKGNTAATTAAGSTCSSRKIAKEEKKKKGTGAAVNTAAQGSEELAPKLTGATGSLSVTAPEANVAVYEFHPLMMWHTVEEQPAGVQPLSMISSIQIGDGPVVYSSDVSSMAAGSELTVLMVTAEQGNRNEWLSVDGLVMHPQQLQPSCQPEQAPW